MPRCDEFMSFLPPSLYFSHPDSLKDQLGPLDPVFDTFLLPRSTVGVDRKNKIKCNSSFYDSENEEQLSGSFFRALFLDRSYLSEDDIHISNITQPLRVRKKLPLTTAFTPRPRRSSLSLPRSPSSPQFFHSQLCAPIAPPSPQVPAISPAGQLLSPLAFNERPLPPLPSNTTSHLCPPSFVKDTSYLEHLLSMSLYGMANDHPWIRSPSELHLGLGKFSVYDEDAKPGPSPPTSPASSPTKRAFTTQQHSGEKFLLYTPSPRTFTTNPRKGVELIGAAYNSPRPRAKKRSEHFRPLPSSKLAEIEHFFGKPKSPSTRSRPRTSGPGAAQTRQRSRAAGIENPGNLGDRCVGEGKTAGQHIGADGSMWRDVEEEQEFAWLMSDIFASLPPHPPPTIQPDINMLFEGDQEPDWGMETFTSVLSLPKKRSPPKVMPHPVPILSPARRVLVTAVAHPWSSAALGTSSTPNSKPQFEIHSLNRDQDHPDIHVASIPTSSITASMERRRGVSSDEESSRPKKCRPPPLQLAPTESVHHRLPVVTASSPTDPHSQHGQTEEIMITPFVHPRVAPHPSTTLGSLLGPLPSLRIEHNNQEEISYFEPDTPVRAAPLSRIQAPRLPTTASRVAAAGTATVEHGTKWLKSLVKPLKV